MKKNISNFAKDNRIIKSIVYTIRYFCEKRGYIIGKNNIVINHGVKIVTRICIKGNNNTIIIDEHAIINNSLIKILGNNNMLHFKKKSYIEGATLHIEDNRCSIVIGDNTFIGSSHLAVTENESTIIIGNNCMLSSNINLRTGDSHSIIDTKLNLRINPAQNIFIGDHCWIGEGAKILKGVILENDVIVATGAIVSKSFPSNVLIGGIPAKVLRDNVTWDKNRV